MKILYYTFKAYTWNVYGTARSMAEDLGSRGHQVVVLDKSQIGSILESIEHHKPDQIWFVNSGLIIPEKTKKEIKIPIIGFGLSDPYLIMESAIERFHSYDIYVTNHIDTFNKYNNDITCHYFPVACNLKFHKPSNMEKTSFSSLIGTADHPRFIDSRMRMKFVGALRDKGVRIDAYGDGWHNHEDNHAAINGDGFLNAIHRSRIGIDIQEEYSPLAHRLFEYGACGVPSITRDRPEVYSMFEDDEILVYKTYEDLESKLLYYRDNLEELAKIGQKSMERCQKNHDITNRVDDLLDFLRRLNLAKKS